MWNFFFSLSRASKHNKIFCVEYPIYKQKLCVQEKQILQLNIKEQLESRLHTRMM